MGLDRIKQSVPVYGTNPVQLTLSASPGGYRPFIAGLTVGAQTTICILDTVTFDFEVTMAMVEPATAEAPGGSLYRFDPITTSNNNIAVNFAGNNCDVFVVDTAAPSAAAVSGQTGQAGSATPAQLTAYFAALPTAPPAGGGLWLNGGVLCFAPTSTAPDPNSETLLAYFATLPTTPPAAGGTWLDGGVVAVAPAL